MNNTPGRRNSLSMPHERDDLADSWFDLPVLTFPNGRAPSSFPPPRAREEDEGPSDEDELAQLWFR